MTSTRRKKPPIQGEIKARTTMYKGIKMRSRLEADFAAFLDQNHANWDYEPICFAGPDGQWLPDFVVRHSGMSIYFEIKPSSLLDDDGPDIDVILERMTVAWLTEPAAILQLTFWSYGVPRESYTFFGIPTDDEDDWIWWCGDGLTPDKVTPWIGMGQLLRMCERIQREQEAAGESS